MSCLPMCLESLRLFGNCGTVGATKRFHSSRRQLTERSLFFRRDQKHTRETTPPRLQFTRESIRFMQSILINGGSVTQRSPKRTRCPSHSKPFTKCPRRG